MVMKFIYWIRDKYPIDLSIQEIPKQGYVIIPEYKAFCQDPLSFSLQQMVLGSPSKAGQRFVKKAPFLITPRHGEKIIL